MHKIKLRDVWHWNESLGYSTNDTFVLNSKAWRKVARAIYTNKTEHAHTAQYAHQNYFIRNRWNNPNGGSGIQLMTIHLLWHTFFFLRRRRCNLARIVMYYIWNRNVSFIKSEGSHIQRDWSCDEIQFLSRIMKNGCHYGHFNEKQHQYRISQPLNCSRM